MTDLIVLGALVTVILAVLTLAVGVVLDLAAAGVRLAARRYRRERCDRCGGRAVVLVRCWRGCDHRQCQRCAERTAREAA